MSLQDIIEDNISRPTFSMKNTREQSLPLLEKEIDDLDSLKKKLSSSKYNYIINSLIRAAFLIELVNDDISSTKMGTRWRIKPAAGKKQEAFDQSDPRFASFGECKKIFEKLISGLCDVLNDEKIEILCKFQEFKINAYELPIDYIKSETSHMHSSSNMIWFWDEKYIQTIQLRSILMSDVNPQANTFSKMLKDKIKVKTYLTDRVQTGNHKTNREKRWEVHPNSVHFALRRKCLLIEKTLIEQVLNFKNCPEDILKSTEELVEKTDVYRCPVSLFPMNFLEFENEILHPIHGESKFQVGHLNPLKYNSNNRENTHSFENIGWITDHGNRIQGSLSLNEIKDLLQLTLVQKRVRG